MERGLRAADTNGLDWGNRQMATIDLKALVGREDTQTHTKARAAALDAAGVLAQMQGDGVDLVDQLHRDVERMQALEQELHRAAAWPH